MASPPVTANQLLSILRSRQQLEVNARSQPHSATQWNDHGLGTVQVTEQTEYIFFHEHITLDSGLKCHDEKRWRWVTPFLHFERLRQGHYQPLFRFRLANGQLIAHQPHWCAPDTYTAALTLDSHTLTLRIDITGPKKAETLIYRYTP